MKKGFEAFIIIFLVLLAVFSLESYARDNQCSDDLVTGDRAVCYNGNFIIDSTLGFGAAEICGSCYVCGDADGVCPEDFKEIGIPDKIANCSGCNDPDCFMNVSGHVYDYEEFASYSRLTPISYAQVKGVAHNYLIPEVVGQADVNGYYEITIPNGKVTLSASQLGYDTQLYDNYTFYQRQTIDIDFFLPNATCHADCTDYFNRCNKDCQGIKGCRYADWDPLAQHSNISELCHQRTLTSTIVLNSSENYTTSTVCCRGDVNLTSYTPQYLLTGTMKNLVTYNLPGIYNGMPVQVIVATWK
ncbi:MAG: hypothetical protein V1743_08345 [Nanoarchaeota archaeon]